MERMTWDDICCRGEFVGRWVALSSCTYDEHGKAREGSVVDTDENLVELCARLGEHAYRNCDILFCSQRERARLSDMPPAMPRESRLDARHSSIPPRMTSSRPPAARSDR